MSLNIRSYEKVWLAFEDKHKMWNMNAWNATDYCYLNYSYWSNKIFNSYQEMLMYVALRGIRLFKVNRRINNVYVSFVDLVNRFEIKEI